jgi:hypothetical protein
LPFDRSTASCKAERRGRKIVGAGRLPGSRNSTDYCLLLPRRPPTQGPDQHQPRDRLADGRLPTNRSESDRLNRWFDTSAFRRPAAGQIGTGGVGILIGPGLFNADGTLMKNTAIHERLNLQFRAEFFNMFNHPNFDLPVADVTSSAFGRIASTNAFLFPRQIQFGLRLQF